MDKDKAIGLLREAVSILGNGEWSITGWQAHALSKVMMNLSTVEQEILKVEEKKEDENALER